MSAGIGRRFFFTCGALLVAVTHVVGMSEPIELGVGETTSFEDLGLSLTFVGVTGDSRCPRDVTCIVAGEAVVVLEAQLDDETTELTFRVPPGGGDEQELEGLTIAIVKLEPETLSTRTIAPEDYVATITVTEKQGDKGM